MKEKTFLLRLPEELHKEIKIYCVERGISMKDFIMKAVTDRVEKKILSFDKKAV